MGRGTRTPFVQSMKEELTSRIPVDHVTKRAGFPFKSGMHPVNVRNCTWFSCPVMWW